MKYPLRSFTCKVCDDLPVFRKRGIGETYTSDFVILVLNVREVKMSVTQYKNRV